MVTEKKLYKRRIFGYLMGMIPMTLFAGFFGTAYTKFFLDELKLPAYYFIIALVIYAVVNMFNDPIIGNMSDNTNAKKWGSRRIIYIKFGAPLLTIAFVLIWVFPRPEWSGFILFIYFVITICFYETFFTMVVMCWYALLPEITLNVDQRAKINFIGSILMLISGLPTILVSTLSFDDIKFWSYIVGAIGFICYLFVIIFSKESPEFHNEKATPLVQSIKEVWKSKGYRVFMLYNFLHMIGGSLNSSFLFLFWYWIGEGNILYYFLVVVVVGYGSNIVCLALRKKYGIVKLITVFGIIRFAVAVATFVLVMIPATQWFLWIGLVLIYFFNGPGVFTYILQTAPIDEDEMKYGSRREGMFFGINALFTMPANSIGPIIGTILMVFGFGYIQGAEGAAQPDSVFTGIKFIFILLPHLLGLIALLVARKYPLNNKELINIETNLEILHKEKKERMGIKPDPLDENTPG